MNIRSEFLSIPQNLLSSENKFFISGVSLGRNPPQVMYNFDVDGSRFFLMENARKTLGCVYVAGNQCRRVLVMSHEVRSSYLYISKSQLASVHALLRSQHPEFRRERKTTAIVSSNPNRRATTNAAPTVVSAQAGPPKCFCFWKRRGFLWTNL